MPNGKPARTAGIVTCRQRPGTAQGVVFVTLEDETGYTNVVVWNDLVESQRKELLGARLLGVEGYMQKESGVIHLVARRLVDHSRLLGRLSPSRGIFTERSYARDEVDAESFATVRSQGLRLRAYSARHYAFNRPESLRPGKALR